MNAVGVDEIGFRGPAAAALAGITFRQLDYWARSGLVPPSIAEAHGSGTQRRYSRADVICLRVVHAISTAGGVRIGGGTAVNTTPMRQALAVVCAALPELSEFDLAVLAVSSRSARILRDGLDLAALGLRAEPVLLVPLGPVLAGLVES